MNSLKSHSTRLQMMETGPNLVWPQSLLSQVFTTRPTLVIWTSRKIRAFCCCCCYGNQGKESFEERSSQEFIMLQKDQDWNISIVSGNKGVTGDITKLGDFKSHPSSTLITWRKTFWIQYIILKVRRDTETKRQRQRKTEKIQRKLKGMSRVLT